jgi:hypothetical protein
VFVGAITFVTGTVWVISKVGVKSWPTVPSTVTVLVMTTGSVGRGVKVGVGGIGVAVGGSGVKVGVEVLVGVAVGVKVGVGVFVEVEVAVGVAVSVGVGVAGLVGVLVGVAVEAIAALSSLAWLKPIKTKAPSVMIKPRAIPTITFLTC